jgi:hypothetical protein
MRKTEGQPSARPARQTIRIASKRTAVRQQGGICKCGCGQVVSEKPKTNTHFDHRPPIRLRNVNQDGSDYDPPQQDPRYIDAICPVEHRRRTSGTGATVAGSDIGLIKKERRREKRAAGARAKPKAKIQSPGFRRDLTRGFDGKIRRRET